MEARETAVSPRPIVKFIRLACLFFLVGMSTGCSGCEGRDDGNSDVVSAFSVDLSLDETRIALEPGESVVVSVALEVSDSGGANSKTYTETVDLDVLPFVTLTRTSLAETENSQSLEYLIEVAEGAPLGFFDIVFEGSATNEETVETDTDQSRLVVELLRPERAISTPAVQAVAAGSTHSVALLVDGTVWAWGSNSGSQIDADTGQNVFVPIQIEGLPAIVAIAAGFRHTLALDEDGDVWAWGENESGELGDGTQTTRAEPRRVENVLDAIGIVGGGTFSAALLADGTVSAWGGNDFGETGTGRTDDPVLVPQVVPGIDSVVALAGGVRHILALREDGSVWGWGSGRSGQLGDGDASPDNIGNAPGAIGGITSAVGIGVAFETSYAELSDGALVAFGLGNEGEIGNGSLSGVASPTAVSTTENIRRIINGPSAKGTLVTTESGRTLGWGRTSSGQLAILDPPAVTTPIEIAIPPMEAVAGGLSHSLSLERNGPCGVVWAWGFDGTGPLGDGRERGGVRETPEVVPGLGAADCVSFVLARSGTGRVVGNLGELDCGANCEEFYAPGDQLILGVTEGREDFLGFGADCANEDGSLNTTEPLMVSLDNHTRCTAVFADAAPGIPPTAAFDFMPMGSITTDTFVEFDASASTDDGTIVRFDWDYDDDGSFNDSGEVVSTRFPAAGDYQVRLRVEDNEGLTADATAMIQVEAGGGGGGGSPTFYDLGLDFDGTGTGLVRIDPIGLVLPNTDCDGSFCFISDIAEGETLTLVAIENGGGGFAGWGANDCDSVSGNECTLNVNSDRQVDVSFSGGG